MIEHKTVFVLGAGASCPYGFPSGAGLRASICRFGINTPHMANHLRIELGISEDDSKTFVSAFYRSRVQSIDAFLERRPEFVEVGKAAIAYYLCASEIPADALNKDDERDWFRFLWNKMIDGTTDPERVVSSPVRFITFNYDRFLEFSFLSAFQHTFGISDERALELSRKIAVLHVYGKLGDLGLRTADASRAYEASASAVHLRTAMSQIQLIAEHRAEAQKDFAMGRAWFDWAQRICFLGFGFDPTNVERLDLASVLRSKGPHQWPRVVASVKGLELPEQQNVRQRLGLPETHWVAVDGDCVSAIRKGGVLIN